MLPYIISQLEPSTNFRISTISGHDTLQRYYQLQSIPVSRFAVIKAVNRVKTMKYVDEKSVLTCRDKQSIITQIWEVHRRK